MPLAGGTDLVIMRASGVVSPSVLVDLKRLAKLKSVEATQSGFTIGTLATMETLARRDDRGLGALVDGAAVVGAPQTRARATLGGNVCRSSPAGDTLAGLLVLEADAELSTAAGTRRLSLAQFFTGPGTNALEGGELLVRLHLPRLGGGSAYGRLTYRRWMDLAVVGVAARLLLDEQGECVDASIALSAAAPTPILVPEVGATLVGSRCELDALETACGDMVRAATPIDDVRGTRRYRERVLRPLGRRVLGLAYLRATREARGD